MRPRQATGDDFSRFVISAAITRAAPGFGKPDEKFTTLPPLRADAKI
jgi:hypothetical protein